ncbi:adenosine kinase [Phaeovibrio sulfidiphilus]|uniref:Adenosine kinase n=1 Tax=Phaeovibrio sulfidiphilus TaxID=1220600 RepID=A0A8J6YN77_9PROT|nr:adenosine kinase [Phaeovibrio sulfidiphilus]MBE1237888.1 adenosine kinase [Phaeovibrio sulfidiphilus]
MTDPRFDVVGIGSAIVDILAHADDSFLAAQDLPKSGMVLIDEARAEALYTAMGPAVEISGGSASNTMAGIASLGGRGAYIGKVRNDTLGGIFTHDIRAMGVHFDTAPLSEGPATARCMVLVTPDAERTMATYLGACTRLGPDDINREVVADAAITYVEGYQWDMAAAKDAILVAADTARAHNRRFAFSLSDSFCVDRHRAEFLDLIRNRVDILFANTAEVLALTETEDFDAASRAMQQLCPLSVLTRSGDGCRIVTSEGMVDVPAHRVDTIVDMTGAGDQFAAGFLWGLCRGHDYGTCGRIAAVCAAEAISHLGARPNVPSLAALVHETLGLNGTPQ